jgi:transposase-like protein
MLRPKEVCVRLSVSSATLRRWSDNFSEFLSPTAVKSITETGGAAQRRYSEQDFVVLTAVKQLLDDGNTYEETARKLSESVLWPGVDEHDNVNLARTEPLMSDSLIAAEAFRQAIDGKDQAIQALHETIEYQRQLLAELRYQRDALEDRLATPPALPTATTKPMESLPVLSFWQRIDWLLRGRMIKGQREERLDAPEGSSQRLLPSQEPA